jgi:hypothetical protein
MVARTVYCLRETIQGRKLIINIGTVLELRYLTKICYRRQEFVSLIKLRLKV